MNFEPFIDNICDKEAPGWRDGADGYVDHADDRGGPTRYGITQAVARANGWQGDMREMPLSLARTIYRKRYIAEPAFDLVALQSPLIAAELIDTGVNMGPSRASEMLQRWLNGFNAQGSRYADVFVDGRIGEVTLNALRKYLSWRSEDGIGVMVAALNCTQGARYLELAETNQTQESFLYGWIRSRVVVPA